MIEFDAREEAITSYSVIDDDRPGRWRYERHFMPDGRSYISKDPVDEEDFIEMVPNMRKVPLAMRGNNYSSSSPSQ